MSELIPRQWEEGEEAGWIADKVCALGDYGQNAAMVLRRQVSELAALREKCAELQRQLDETANQEPVGYIDDYGLDALKRCEAALVSITDNLGKDSSYCNPLFALPPDIFALIEQAKTEECERCVKLIEAQDVDPAFKNRIINSLMRKG